MKQKLEAILSDSRMRTILTVIVVAAIVTLSIGIGSTMAANDKNSEPLAISEKAAQEIAMNKTDGGILQSFKTEYDDGVKIYKIEIAKGDYEYEIKIDAQTGEVIGYDQERIIVTANNTAKTTTEPAVTKNKSNSSSSETSSNEKSSSTSTSSSSSSNTSSNDKTSNNSYIGESKAKSIALSKVGGGKVVSCYLDYDDGRAEYDIKIYYGKYEYEMEIDAKTGKIRDFEKELQDKYEYDDDDDDWDDDYDD